MIKKTGEMFKVTQLDNALACSSLLIKVMGPQVYGNQGRLVKVGTPDIFFQMFDNLFKTTHPDRTPVRDYYSNPTDYFGKSIGTSGYRPWQYGFFIFYCAGEQITTTGEFLESIGCTVQKTVAKKTESHVALYVIESFRFLDLYEEWMEKAKGKGHVVFGTKRDKYQRPPWR